MKRQLQFLLLLTVCMGFNSLFAQRNQISGTVVCNNETIQGVIISIQPIEKVAVTDSSGNFIISEIPNGIYYLSIKKKYNKTRDDHYGTNH